SWAILGHKTVVAEEPWPEADPALLVEDTVTITVQVNGKRRDELTIARDAAKEDIEAAALKLDNVLRAIAGRKIKKAVGVPQRVLNVVAWPCCRRGGGHGGLGAWGLGLPAALRRHHRRRAEALRRDGRRRDQSHSRPRRPEDPQRADLRHDRRRLSGSVAL